MPGLVPGIHVLRAEKQEGRGWPGHLARRRASAGRDEKEIRAFFSLEETPMKLSFSPASPFARKVRIAAIELGLIDKIEFIPAVVAPGQPNDCLLYTSPSPRD